MCRFEGWTAEWLALAENGKQPSAFRVPVLLLEVTAENMVDVAKILERINVELQNSILRSNLCQQLLNCYEVNNMTPEEAGKDITQKVRVLENVYGMNENILVGQDRVSGIIDREGESGRLLKRETIAYR